LSILRKISRSQNGHTCHKNWDGTSTAMEAQIIVEGFLSSVDMHGLKYKTFLRDGDSIQ
jgi:hypothetical protein